MENDAQGLTNLFLMFAVVLVAMMIASHLERRWADMQAWKKGLIKFVTGAVVVIGFPVVFSILKESVFHVYYFALVVGYLIAASVAVAQENEREMIRANRRAEKELKRDEKWKKDLLNL